MPQETLQSQWDKATPQQPALQQEWDSAAPANDLAPATKPVPQWQDFPSGLVDSDKLTRSLINGKLFEIQPSVAYNNDELLSQQAKNKGMVYIHLCLALLMTSK